MTAKFHYLVRTARDEDDQPVKTSVSAAEYREAMDRLVNAPPTDVSTQEAVDKLRFGSTVPILDCKMVEKDMYFGVYKGVYTGHSYENTSVGTIPYFSASLRKFFFLVYRSPLSGKVYIGTQYLGQFGSYDGLKNTIIRAFENRRGLEGVSFRNLSSAFHKVEAKEIIVNYSRKSSSLSEGNAFGQAATIVLKRGSSNDFAGETRRRIFPLINSPKDQVRSAIGKILREDQLIEVADDDIADCVVIAEVDGRDKRYHFINESNVATPFYLSVGLAEDGHPEAAQVQAALRKILKEEIISKAENV